MAAISEKIKQVEDWVGQRKLKAALAWGVAMKLFMTAGFNPLEHEGDCIVTVVGLVALVIGVSIGKRRNNRETVGSDKRSIRIGGEETASRLCGRYDEDGRQFYRVNPQYEDPQLKLKPGLYEFGGQTEDAEEVIREAAKNKHLIIPDGMRPYSPAILSNAYGVVGNVDEDLPPPVGEQMKTGKNSWVHVKRGFRRGSTQLDDLVGENPRDAIFNASLANNNNYNGVSDLVRAEIMMNPFNKRELLWREASEVGTMGMSHDYGVENFGGNFQVGRKID